MPPSHPPPPPGVKILAKKFLKNAIIYLNSDFLAAVAIMHGCLNILSIYILRSKYDLIFRKGPELSQSIPPPHSFIFFYRILSMTDSKFILSYLFANNFCLQVRLQLKVDRIRITQRMDRVAAKIYNITIFTAAARLHIKPSVFI